MHSKLGVGGDVDCEHDFLTLAEIEPELAGGYGIGVVLLNRNTNIQGGLLVVEDGEVVDNGLAGAGLLAGLRDTPNWNRRFYKGGSSYG